LSLKLGTKNQVNISTVPNNPIACSRKQNE